MKHSITQESAPITQPEPFIMIGQIEDIASIGQTEDLIVTVDLMASELFRIHLVLTSPLMDGDGLFIQKRKHVVGNNQIMLPFSLFSLFILL